MKTPKNFVNHPVARVSGVTENDTRIQAAEKAVATMRMAGFSERDIRKAQKMVDDAKARGVK
jgi:Holliday junction resolvasome RuvABC DNA-binding subunit